MSKLGVYIITPNIIITQIVVIYKYTLSGNNNTRFSIDGATAGTQYLVVSKHIGVINTGAREGDT